MGKRTGRPPGRPRKDSIVPSLVKEKPQEKWKWDDAHTACLNMTVAGFTKVAIAKELEKHRSTIIEWTQREEFRERLSEKMGEHVQAVQFRRINQTSKFADATGRLLEKTYAMLEGNDSDDASVKICAMKLLDLGKEFRSWMAEERIQYGLDGQKKHVTVSGAIVGQIQHDHNHKVSFNLPMREFLDAKIEDGVIDVDALPVTTDRNRLLAGMVTQALADPTTMDLLDEEDRADADE